MKRRINLFVALALLLGCLALCAFAHAESAEDYRGIWVADSVAVEIWLEDGELYSRAVFTEEDDNAVIWDYHSCWYDETNACLECAGVTRTIEHYDWLTENVEELDWSLSDLSFADFKLSEGCLIFTDEALDTPIALKKLSDADAGDRTKGLSFVGRWTAGATELRVEDHGSCYMFTVTVPVDADTSHRWTYTCLYDPDSQGMNSVRISPLRIITREEDGSSEIDDYNTAGPASFAFVDADRLAWYQTKDGSETTFERLDDYGCP